MNRYPLPPHMRRHMMSRRQPNVYALMLFVQLLERISQLNPKPPVTLSIIIANLSIFYLKPLLKSVSPSKLASFSPTVARAVMSVVKALNYNTRDVCLIPRLILSSSNHYRRLVIAAFIHLSDIHVLYNCSSLLYKGVLVEPILGSFHFLALSYVFLPRFIAKLISPIVFSYRRAQSQWVPGHFVPFGGRGRHLHRD